MNELDLHVQNYIIKIKKNLSLIMFGLNLKEKIRIRIKFKKENPLKNSSHFPTWSSIGYLKVSNFREQSNRSNRTPTQFFSYFPLFHLTPTLKIAPFVSKYLLQCSLNKLRILKIQVFFFLSKKAIISANCSIHFREP